MIGSGFKKLAAENGMKVSNGVAYGSLRGYAATLTDGSNCKQIVISTKFADPEKNSTAANGAESEEYCPGIPGAEFDIYACRYPGCLYG